MLKKAIFILIATILVVVLSSCKECGSCHYILDDESEVEMGEFCDEEKDNLIQSGYTDTTGTYDVVCHIH